MTLFSQKDEAYDKLTIGASGLTIHQYGCLLCSMATLYQRNPLDLLKIEGGVTKTGLLVTATIAKALGGSAKKATKTAPDGWCIAMTKHYASHGYPTHFFCYNPSTKEMIDPLDYPAKVRQLAYKIDHYRPFDGIRLDLASHDDAEVSGYLSLAERIKRIQKALQRATGARLKSLQRALDRFVG